MVYKLSQPDVSAGRSMAASFPAHVVHSGRVLRPCRDACVAVRAHIAGGEHAEEAASGTSSSDTSGNKTL